MSKFTVWTVVYLFGFSAGIFSFECLKSNLQNFSLKISQKTKRKNPICILHVHFILLHPSFPLSYWKPDVIYCDDKWTHPWWHPVTLLTSNPLMSNSNLAYRALTKWSVALLAQLVNVFFLSRLDWITKAMGMLKGPLCNGPGSRIPVIYLFIIISLLTLMDWWVKSLKAPGPSLIFPVHMILVKCLVWMKCLIKKEKWKRGSVKLRQENKPQIYASKCAKLTKTLAVGSAAAAPSTT